MCLCVAFCVGYYSFRVNYPVGLEKPACGWTDDLARSLTKKNISCRTQKCNCWKRPSTDFDKKYIFWNRHIISYRMVFVVSFEHFMTFQRTVPDERRKNMRVEKFWGKVRIRKIIYAESLDEQNAAHVFGLFRNTADLGQRRSCYCCCLC